MEWTIVHFTKDNVVEAVPANWVEEGVCYWPPYNASKLTKAIASCEKPVLGVWELYSVRRLGTKNEDSLLKAKLKALRAEDTSDINSEVEGRRRIAKKRKFCEEVTDIPPEVNNSPEELGLVETDSSSSASDCHNESVVMPTPPSARRKHTDEEIDHCEFPGLSSIRSKRQHRIVPLKDIETEKQRMSSVSEDNISEDRRAIFPSTLTQTPQTSGRLLDDTRNRSTSSTDTIQWKQKRPTVRVSNSASTSKTATLDQTPRSSRRLSHDISEEGHTITNISKHTTNPLDQTPRSSRRLSNDISEEGHTITNISQGTRSNMLSDDTFKRQVLRQLQILNIRQQQQSDDISMILQKVGGQDDEKFIVEPDSIFTKFAFPLKTTEDLDTVEDFLSMEENCKRFVKELIGIGGSNYKAMINRILPKLLSNELAKLYSWIGRKGKRNFSLLRLTDQILVAVQKTCKCSKNEIECRIKGWLVKSTEREKKKAAT